MSFSARTQSLIDQAIEEDLGAAGDLTSALLEDAEVIARGRIVTRQDGVAAGLRLLPVVVRRFEVRLGRPLRFEPSPALDRSGADGVALSAGQTLGVLAGSRAAVLAAERTCLNFLGWLSGIATLTRRYVRQAQAANPLVRVLDTRKTTPAWRELERYAVRCGGGENHRGGLFDAVLIKDNHLAGVPADRFAAHVQGMVRKARRHGAVRFVEVEVDTLAQLEAVLGIEGIDIVLLDNFSLDQLREAVRRRDARAPHVRLEASGGVTLETVGPIAATGVDRISVGALTHAARWLDVSMELEG